MTALQHEPSAHAPWTRTMFGLPGGDPAGQARRGDGTQPRHQRDLLPRRISALAVQPGQEVLPGQLRRRDPGQSLPDGQGTSDGWMTCDGYGYGQFIGRIAGHAAYFHPGDNPGYQSLAVWLPGHAACGVILANDEAADTEALLRQLMLAALENDEP
jgi:hypothetical protein